MDKPHSPVVFDSADILVIHEPQSQRASVSTTETVANSGKTNPSTNHTRNTSAAESIDRMHLTTSRKSSKVESYLSARKSRSSLHTSKSQSSLIKEVTRGAPGDAALIAMVNRNADDVREQRRKNQFYSEVFAYREGMATPRERVGKDSVVSAAIKTNVIISDEFYFLTALSSFLSARYARPTTSIMISLDHSACLIYGGSFEPAYHMTVTALPSQVQSTLNKRNAALLQGFMEEELNVAASRGVVNFCAVGEDCLATNGVTVLAEIEALGGKNDAVSAAVARGKAGRRLGMSPGAGLGKVKSQEAIKSTASPRRDAGQKTEKGPKSTKGTKGVEDTSGVCETEKREGAGAEVDEWRRKESLIPLVPKGELRTREDEMADKLKNCRKSRSLMQMFRRG